MNEQEQQLSQEAEAEYQMLVATWGIQILPKPRPTLTHYRRTPLLPLEEVAAGIVIVLAIIVVTRSIWWVLALQVGG